MYDKGLVEKHLLNFWNFLPLKFKRWKTLFYILPSRKNHNLLPIKKVAVFLESKGEKR